MLETTNDIRNALLRVAAALILTAAFAGPAMADQECESDADCGAGFVCEELGVPAIACVCPEGTPDEECGCDDIEAPEPESVCMPAPCEADSDCADGWACMTWTTDCATAPPKAEPDCAPGEDCGGDEDMPGEEEEAEECEPETYGECVPAWATSCESDSDCGAGFTCDYVEECACSSSSGGGSTGSTGSGGNTTEPEPAPEPDGGDDDPDEDEAGSSEGDSGSSSTPDDPGTEDDEPSGTEDDGGTEDDEGDHGDEDMPDGEKEDADGEEGSCECWPSEEMWCQAEETPCTGDGDCPSGWTCEEFGGGETCWADSDGNSGCDEVEGEMLCAPPFWDEFEGGVGGGGSADFDHPAMAGGDDESEEGGNTGTSAPQDDDGGDAAPEPDGINDDGPGGEGAGDDGGSDGDGGGEPSAVTTDDGGSGGGCQGGPLGGALPVLLALVALLALPRRRTV